MKYYMVNAVSRHHKEDRCAEVYLPSQLQTLVAVVISVIHLIVPLSQDHPAHHHGQVDALGPEVKLLHLQTEDDSTVWNEALYSTTPPACWRTGTCVRMRDARSSRASSILVFLGPPHMRCLRTLLPRYLRAWDTEGDREVKCDKYVDKWQKK